MSTASLHAEQLLSDPRVAQARRLLTETLEEYRDRLTGVRGPDPGRQVSYEQTIAEFSELRGGKLFYPYLGSGLGRGALVELADGSVKYDMITGIGVHAFGHSDPELLLSGIEAALSDTVMQGNLQQNAESAELCRAFVRLASQTGAPLQHCFLTTSGAMANENALKLLFQKRAPADRLLAFDNCFAGRTLATAQLTDRAKNREGLPRTLAVDYLPFFDSENPEASTRAACQRLEEFVARYPNAHAGMIMELVQGEGGYYVAPREFYVALGERLRQHGIPLLLDEIQTFGRTSTPFAFQHFQLEEYADVVTVGKMTQVCATLFRPEFRPRPGLISQTFTAAGSSILAALSILTRLEQGNFYGPHGRVMQIHQRFVTRLEEIRQRHPEWVRGPWGIGGMVAFTAFDGSAERTGKVLARLFEAGVITFSAGSSPSRIRMLPPFGVIRDEEIDEVCQLIESTLTELA